MICPIGRPRRLPVSAVHSGDDALCLIGTTRDRAIVAAPEGAAACIVQNCLHAGELSSSRFRRCTQYRDCRRRSKQIGEYSRFPAPGAEFESIGPPKRRGVKLYIRRISPPPFFGFALQQQRGHIPSGRALCAPASISPVPSRCCRLRPRPRSLSRRRRLKATACFRTKSERQRRLCLDYRFLQPAAHVRCVNGGIIYPPLRTARSLGFL